MDPTKFPSQFCADQLRALSEPSRLAIVSLLRQGEMTVGDIATHLDAEVVTISHHLGILKSAGLLESRREGRFIYYRLRPNLIQPGESSREYFNLGCCRLEVPTAES